MADFSQQTEAAQQARLAALKGKKVIHSEPRVWSGGVIWRLEAGGCCRWAAIG